MAKYPDNTGSKVIPLNLTEQDSSVAGAELVGMVLVGIMTAGGTDQDLNCKSPLDSLGLFRKNTIVN